MTKHPSEKQINDKKQPIVKKKKNTQKETKKKKKKNINKNKKYKHFYLYKFLNAETTSQY